MAQVISFFPKQLITSNEEPFSDIFEVTDFSRLVAELRVYAIYPSAKWVSGFILESSDPSLDANAWIANPTGLSIFCGSVTGGSNKKIFTDLQRFIRAKIVTDSGLNAHVSFQAVGRVSS